MDIHDSFSHDQSLHIKLQLINAFIMSSMEQYSTILETGRAGVIRMQGLSCISCFRHALKKT